MEGHDGEVLLGEHGGIDAAGEDGDGQGDEGGEGGVEGGEGGELGECDGELGVGEVVPGERVDGVCLEAPEAAQGQRRGEADVLGDGPGAGDGPELGEDVAAPGEVVEDPFLRRFGQGVVGPDGVGGCVDGLEEQRGGAVAELEAFWVAGEEEVEDEGEDPLGDGDGDEGVEAAEAGERG